MHPIFLIGFMGCGKTTVGRLLAERLGWSFVDVDTTIVEAEGRTIPKIFAEEGEAAFRAAESRVLSEIVSAEDTVVATGGCLFSDPANRRLIAEAGGWSVFLDVAWPILESRLGHQDSTRPMWGSPAEARWLFDRRLRDYGQADAKVTVNENQCPQDVVEAIIKMRPELVCAI
jgi:shikimate kinase